MSNKINRFLVGAGVTVAGVLALSLPAFAYTTLTRQLDIGSQGSDVSEVQTFLAQDPALYPQGLVTGYFGNLTAAAVSNFQTRNGISAVGRVGPVTLVALNNQMGSGLTLGTTKDPVISSVNVNVSRNSATVNWNTNKNAKGVVYYNSSPLVLTEGTDTSSASVSGYTVMTDSNLRTTQNVLFQTCRQILLITT